jgi:hypothetical protein
MAALSALPLIAQAGQGLISTIGQDVASFFGAPPAGSTGQNVQGPASPTQSPSTVSAASQSLSSSVMSVLNAVQSDLSQVGDFASGKTGVTKFELEQAAQSVGAALGQSPAAASAGADQAFGAIDTAGSGQITVSQLGAYLGQTQASQKYQAADNLVNGFLSQMSGLLSGQTSATA